jgi:multiple antibiotic resistance protein
MISVPLLLQLFAIINPLSSFPVLMSAFRKGMDVRKIAAFSVAIAFAIAIVMVFIGPAFFALFGVGMNSFMIAGGIVLLMLGIDTIKDGSDRDRGINEMDGMVSLIATPLLTGPATISFITIKAYTMDAISLSLNVCAAFIAVAAVFMVFSTMVPKINVKVVNIVSKIMGLFLTAMAIEMIGSGIGGMIGLLAHRRKKG